MPPEQAEPRRRRALLEAWAGRETAAFRLPPSRLALDPADAIRLALHGRLVDLRLVSIADAEGRRIEAVRQDRATNDLPPGDPRAASLRRVAVFGAPEVGLMDLPQLTEDQPAHRPLVGAHAGVPDLSGAQGRAGAGARRNGALLTVAGQARLLAARQFALRVAVVVDQYPPEPVSGRAAQAIAKAPPGDLHPTNPPGS